MADSKYITYSLTIDRKLYNEYKSAVVFHGENVKTNLVNYMKEFILNSKPNLETLEALKESDQIAYDPNVPGYNSINDLREALDA